MDQIPLNQIGTSGATNGQIPVYNSTTKRWVPTTRIKGLLQGSNVTIDNTNPEFPVISSSGGGGGGGGSYQPGSADVPPSTPNIQDDEFNLVTAATWTNTPTAANTWNVDVDRQSHLHIRSSGTGVALVGKYQPVPASYPYTITAKLKGTSARSNFHRGGGVFVAPASPTGSSNVTYVGALNDTAFGQPYYGRLTETLGGSFVSVATNKYLLYRGSDTYLRLTVNSATSIDTDVSGDGFAWIRIESAFNPGFTPGVMGICVSEESVGGGVDAYFDWFRVNWNPLLSRSSSSGGGGGFSSSINDALSSTAGFKTALNGTWAISSGVLRQSSTAASTAHYTYNTDLSPGPRAVEVECSYVSGAGSVRRMGLVVSSTNVNTGNVVVYAESSTGTSWVIKAESDGVLLWATSSTISYTGSGYLRLGVVQTGSVFEVYLANTYLFSFTQGGQFTPGTWVGLYTYGLSGDFKNLKAWTALTSPFA